MNAATELSATDEPAVRLLEVTRRFREGDLVHVVLDRVSVRFEAGVSIALRGRSGSGKSTLLNLICGIDRPDDGRIVVAGDDLTAMGEHARTLFRRRHVGFVYQAFNLGPTLTVGDNVRLVLELNDVPDREARERVASLLDAIGLAGRAGSYPDVLSGGEQQRVAIARALAHRPPLVLADEPTGNLDDRSADIVLDLLTGLVRDEGGTLIMATHSPSIAAACDRRYEIRDGRVAEGGS